MKKFGVIGHPVSHSLSPLMHEAAYSHLQLQCTYQAFDVTVENLAAAIQQFRDEGFTGLNVTLPLKEAILPFLQNIDPEAESIGAVNTVHFDGSHLTGYNTDVIGLTRTIEPFSQELAGQKAVILGAGGSARSMIFALKNLQLARLTIVGRSTGKMEELWAHAIKLCPGLDVRRVTFASGLLRSTIQEAGLIMNATPIGMFPAVQESPLTDATLFHADQIFLDMIYIPLETALLRMARERGARTLSGLDVFIHQGAAAFKRWNNVPMPVEIIRPVILEALHKRLEGTMKL